MGQRSYTAAYRADAVKLAKELGGKRSGAAAKNTGRHAVHIKKLWQIIICVGLSAIATVVASTQAKLSARHLALWACCKA